MKQYFRPHSNFTIEHSNRAIELILTNVKKEYEWNGPLDQIRHIVHKKLIK